LSKPIHVLKADASWNDIQNLQISWKSLKWYAPKGRLYS